MTRRASSLVQIGAALIAGAGISGLDSFACGGEVSPIVIVGALLLVTATAGVLWGIHATMVAVIVWAWLPMGHLARHLLGLPDTIHPNTYASILKLGIFSFVVSAVGLAIGLGFRRILRVETESA